MSNPNCGEKTKIDKNPFEGLHISDTNILDSIVGRYPCPRCGKSRKYFCYTCYVPIIELEGKLPKVKLPLKIDIIKHKHEIDGKSTAAHAAILASDDISVYTYPDIPTYNAENTVLIFPSYSAVEIGQLFENDCENIGDIKQEFTTELPKGHNKSTLMKHISKNVPSNHLLRKNVIKKLPVDRAVFIDSTWNQSKGIYKDERIKKLPCVVLQNRISQFWRHQKGSPRWYLATIEAIHQFVLELHLNAYGLHPEYKGLPKCFNEKSLVHFEGLIVDKNCVNRYNGQYDNLLFFFKHMYYLIHTYYQHEDLYAYKRRLI